MSGTILRCALSGDSFSISEREAAFLGERGYPLPRLSPKERQRRRLTFRNQRQLFHRACSATGRPIISMYAPDYPGPVVSQDYWWSDSWDARELGREVDFTRPFFEQFHQLFTSVPQPSTMVSLSENCEYNAYCATSKNCYLSQSVAESENIYYTFGPTRSRDCMDCHNIDSCELCYEVIFGSNCYDVRFSKNVASCRESAFLHNCRNCSNCFLCTNLRNAEYCYRNQKLDRASYLAKVAEFSNLQHRDKQDLIRQADEFSAQHFLPPLWGAMNENVSGNQIFQSKNVAFGFDIRDCEDVAHVFRVYGAKNCVDANNVYHGEELYEVISVLRSSRVAFSFAFYEGIMDVLYSAGCVSGSHDLFGCVGIRHGGECILNTQYKPAEYRALRERLIMHLKDTGEWGEFFPSSISPFAYNDTIAHDLFPLTKDEALQRGLAWRDAEAQAESSGRSVELRLETSAAADESICRSVFRCSHCSHDYKIQKAELLLAQKLLVPLPRDCFECRYQARLERLDPLEIHRRQCPKCGRLTETCWRPEAPKVVYCEQCYLEAVA